MDNCYQVIEEGGTFREFPKSHEGLENAIECAWENCTDVVWKHNDVAETVWSIDDVEITWNEDQFNSDAEANADALASAGWGTDEDYGGCCDW
jgi:hypothetical protein